MPCLYSDTYSLSILKYILGREQRQEKKVVLAHPSGPGQHPGGHQQVYEYQLEQDHTPHILNT